MLHGSKLREVYNNCDIVVESTDSLFPFDVSQISEDSIDLRLGTYGYIMNNRYEYMNTLSHKDFSDYYTKVEIPSQGFLLEPHQILFAPSLERISITKTLYCGHLTGRSVYARMGLSIHCTQSKFTTGMNSIVPLQIINNNDKISLKIYPLQKVAQLLIEFVDSDDEDVYSSESQFAKEIVYQLPVVLDKDRIQYKNEKVIENIANDKPPLNKYTELLDKHHKQEDLFDDYINRYNLINKYSQQKLGEFKSIYTVFLGLFSSLILGLFAVSIKSDDLFLPWQGWLILIFVSIIIAVYFYVKYRELKNVLDRCDDNDKEEK